MVPILVFVVSFVAGCLTGVLVVLWSRRKRQAKAKGRRPLRSSSPEPYSLDSAHGAAAEGGTIRRDSGQPR
jgi:hypothetical protein